LIIYTVKRLIFVPLNSLSRLAVPLLHIPPLRKNTLSLVSESSRETLTILTDDVHKAQRYAEKTTTNASALSLTLEAAEKHHGIDIINDSTTQHLLHTLDKAMAVLRLEKPIRSDSECALSFAIAHLSEREAAFSRTDLLKTALEKSIGTTIHIDGLEEALNHVMAKEEVIQGSGGWLTTKEAVAFETQIIDVVKSGVNAVSPLLSVAESQAKLQATQLTDGQKEACLLITTARDRFIMIQGYAGTGKTTMTKTTIECLEQGTSMVSGGIDIVAVAPTHQAVKEIVSLGIKAQTLKSFLIEQSEAPTLSTRSLVLLDESSMVSNRDCAQLVTLIHKAGARGVLLGDISQHQSIESGKPSQLLMQSGNIRVACMDDIVRQQIAGYKEAVQTLVNGETSKALVQFALLNRNAIKRQDPNSPYHALTASVIETGNSEAIDGLEAHHSTPIEMAVGDYLSRTHEVRNQTIVVIHENKKRDIANDMIRCALMKESTLGHENKPFSRLLSTNYTTAELYFCETYHELREKGTFFLKKNNEYHQVVRVDEQAKIVWLKDEKGKDVIFMPEKESQDWKIELFQLAEGNLSVGEKIHFKKSDKQIGRFANERLEVIAVDKVGFSVKDSSGTEHQLLKNNMNDCHWDYSYTATSYSIQGASSPFVIGVAETGNKQMNHFRSFYIMVTRGSLHAMIYTDNYKTLNKQLRVTPDKKSALETLNRIPKVIQIPIDKMASSKKIDEKRNAIKKDSIIKPINPHYDARDITQTLTQNTESVVERLLGEPNRTLSSKNDHRYGRCGSLSVCLNGEKRGTWYNFETGEKGNLLHLIQQTLNIDFKDSLVYAAKLIGEEFKYTIPSQVHYNQEKKDKKISDKKNTTLDYALKLAKESQAIQGTLAEHYLKEIRGIHNISGDNIRFHPNVFTDKSELIKYRPALLNIVKNKDHAIVSVEAVYLDDKTANKADMAIKPKKSFGSKKGAGVILNQGNGEDCVTYLAEGVETALSIRDAVKSERVIAILGKENFANIDGALITNRVVLCLDNDGKSIHTDPSLIKTIGRLIGQGKLIEIAAPSKVKDFNDVSMQKGVSGVISELNQSICIDKMHYHSHKIDMDDERIKQCLIQISKNLDLRIPENKKLSVDKNSVFKSLDREII
jgi:hypothetical protein